MELDWGHLRDITEASALFFHEMMERGSDMSSLGGGDSRNAPDLLADIGLQWANAAWEKDSEMDGEYIEALDRYVRMLCAIATRNTHDIHCMSSGELKNIAIKAIDNTIHEWERAFKEREHA